MNKVISVRLDKETKKKLEEISKKNRRSLSAQVRHWIDKEWSEKEDNCKEK
jgi:predicted DNA-binding protein